MSHVVRVASLLALGSCAGIAHAQWSAVSLHPPGTLSSRLITTDASHATGNAQVGPDQHAGLWDLSTGAWTDLHPANPAMVSSSALAQQDGRQFGQVTNRATFSHAATWSGSPASWTDLNPIGAYLSSFTCVGDGFQAGFAQVGDRTRASLWHGTAESWVDLHPPEARGSYIFGASRGQQVGRVDFDRQSVAALWRGPGQPWVNLHPAGAMVSSAAATDGERQVGNFSPVPPTTHACLWHGTASSIIDLHPAGADTSRASDIRGRFQVGSATVAGITHASLWAGSADSWLDLAAFLPPGSWGFSSATSLWIGDDAIRIAGQAFSNDRGRLEAILWSFPLCPADFDRDTRVSDADRDGFTAAFESGDPAADFNHDGFLDFFDYAGFLDAFESGC